MLVKAPIRPLPAEEFSTNIANLIAKILTKILSNGVVTNKEILLKRIGQRHNSERCHVQKTKVLRAQLKSILRTEIKPKPWSAPSANPILQDLNYTLKNLVVDFVQELIQPNITLNRSETQERENKIAQRNQAGFAQNKSRRNAAS